MRPFGVVLLAAGASARLGQSKQLLPFRDATLVAHAARTALKAGAGQVVVVLGSRAADVRAALDGIPVQTTYNAAWEAGMGGSIACGVAELNSEVEACVLMLVDQPAVTSVHIQALVELRETRDGPFVATEYGGAPGVPCAFSRSMFDRLRQLSGDQGARVLLRDAEVVPTISLPGAQLDIDTAADLAILATLEGRSF